MAVRSRGPLLWSAAILGIAFLGIQFIRPELANSPASADVQVPPEVKQILRTSCYDCHSTETNLSWFDRPAPAYWVVVSDVREGRKHLNFSDIGNLAPGQQRASLFESVNHIELGAMPPAAYRLLHPESKVTPTQLALLKKYLSPAAPAQAATPAEVASADAQYDKWIQASKATPIVAPAPNGIAFVPEYKSWRAVSSTERFDNHTMRVILGNDVAVEAIAGNRINPWPDGTAFAKVAWLEQADVKGAVHAGAFFQVELMIRDSKKYAETKGWGWARWRGADLKPYGKDATFTNECVGCHAPLIRTNYVFTTPIRGVNERASMAGDLPANPLQWQVITSAIDKNDTTMSTLYGNDVAVRYARANSQHDYPAGSALSLVTWTQRDDSRWFGAKIPDQVKSVEFVFVEAAAAGGASYAYQKYEGSPLKRVSAQQGLTPDDRTAYLLSQRAAVMP
jgi:hypothetical protein